MTEALGRATEPGAADRGSRLAPLRRTALAVELRSPSFALLAVTLAISLVRVRDQPALHVSIGATSASLVPSDVLLLLLAVVAVVGIARAGVGRSRWGPLVAAGAFALLIVATAAANGSTAFVSGARVAELAALGLGAAVLVRSWARAEALVDLLLVVAVLADVVAIAHYATTGGGRQDSFLGEHDYAALATLPLLAGLGHLHVRGNGRRAWLAIAAGGVGCILGGALASLLGFYLGVAVLIVCSWSRRLLTRRNVLATAAVVAVVSIGTVGIRPGELGFVPSWLGRRPSHPGQYAGSWSQRLIYTYVGGRVFLDHPILGTGWYGELPPPVFDRYLPAARRHFNDQPVSYFPPAGKPYVPQQTYDEILYELGAVGAVCFLVLLGFLIRAAAVAARERGQAAALLPATWLGAIIGALAGEALWGGTAITTLFWFVAGVIVALGARAGAAPGRGAAASPTD